MASLGRTNSRSARCRAGGPPPIPGDARAGFDLRGFLFARLCQPCGNPWVEQVGEALSEARALHLVIHDPEAGECGLAEAGDFAVDLTAEWVEAPARPSGAVLDTVSALVRIVREEEPEQASALLERARALDRCNEAIYRGIARLQAHLGQHDAIPRTLAPLTTTLAEFDEEPSQEILALCASPHRPGPVGRTPSGGAAG